ncbi:cobalt-precorrin-4/precorrin-4 C(11)-methyltransferase [Amycolatopsis sp. MtRt-6]|uniref:cobalt-precorrin-4/precorrin-4 C(11)-methyltransferase n=1 Tax=Amycolatopsis sp. MtRt-6 TaxID=2792782 RepID=UPI001A8D8AC0|nr:cobalt-precorrin-4/precorrin-4 C(11)-methyltransferase [Amycolatopsis sp. MtRt-6]
MISFVGGGPGAADLLTVRAVRRLAVADVVIWASSLVTEDVVAECNPAAVIHDSAGMTLDDVLRVYAAHPDARIVRLHSGDVSVFSSITEQIEWCESTGREWEIVPGVGSLAAACAAAGVELTVPTISQSVVLTRLGGGRTAGSMRPGESIPELARTGATMAVYLSAARPEQLRAELIDDGRGYPPDTPAVVVAKASWPDQLVIDTTVDRLPEALSGNGIRTVALVLVGAALKRPNGGVPRSRVYDPAYSHGCRRRSTEGSTVGRPIPAAKRRRP